MMKPIYRTRTDEVYGKHCKSHPSREEVASAKKIFLGS